MKKPAEWQAGRDLSGCSYSSVASGKNGYGIDFIRLVRLSPGLKQTCQ